MFCGAIKFMNYAGFDIRRPDSRKESVLLGGTGNPQLYATGSNFSSTAGSVFCRTLK